MPITTKCSAILIVRIKADKKFFLVHGGDYEVQQDWREKLLSKGFTNIEIPEMKKLLGSLKKLQVDF